MMESRWWLCITCTGRLQIKADRYYKVRFYPLCMNRSYNYPWSSDWSRGLSPKEKIIWMYPGNISNLFLFNKRLFFCFESWEFSTVLLVASCKTGHQNFRKCQICQILKRVSRLAWKMAGSIIQGFRFT